MLPIPSPPLPSQGVFLIDYVCYAKVSKACGVLVYKKILC